jgi:hypothetical protein
MEFASSAAIARSNRRCVSARLRSTSMMSERGG